MLVQVKPESQAQSAGQVLQFSLASPVAVEKQIENRGGNHGHRAESVDQHGQDSGAVW